MVKYNYAGAAALWDEYYKICICDMSFSGEEKRQERRAFMYAVTHCIDINIYTNYIEMLIDELKPAKDLKSRCYDFKTENELNEIKKKIVIFSHCIERYADYD